MNTLRLDDSRPGVVRLTLHRPDRLNAMTAEMFVELAEAAERIRLDDSIRAVVLCGAGAGFCAGYDVEAAKDFAATSTAQLLDLQDSAWRALHAIYSLPKPVIAAVHGAAVGGGFSLSLAADIRLAGASARFQAIFIRRGLSGADLGTSWFLPRMVGTGLAAELLYTGRPVYAEEAVRIGIANRTVADEVLLDEADELAGRIAEHAPLAVALTKRSLRANVDAPSLLTALELESRAQVSLMHQQLNF
ncbi:enoyl-CoA hydratase/isomerase family protein [Pseudonocardia spinosispora]|uniref:enoyl-CoA hydratase/isomerase family protein n=1 Tax=Pseudonocardia spinosispora TaxID=103441 RepID=UPI0004124BAE|nr:enoyl-CoA hydratase-related protein [Pseudonocardia spinosispora]